MCSWKNSSIGSVNGTAAPIKCLNGKPGCKNTLHHNCVTEWEMAQYLIDDPHGAPDKCTYDSDGKKCCIFCHKYSVVALSMENSNDTVIVCGATDESSTNNVR